MSTFLLMIGFLGFIAGVVWFVVRLIKRETKKPPLILLAAMFAAFLIGGFTGDSGKEDSSPQPAEVVRAIPVNEDDAQAEHIASEPVSTAAPTSTPEPAVWPPPASELPSEPTPELMSAQTPVPTSMPEPTATPTPTSTSQLTQEPTPTSDIQYVNLVLNSNPDRMRAHLPGCRDVPDIAPENRINFNGTIEEAKAMGYVPCGHCHPW